MKNNMASLLCLLATLIVSIASCGGGGGGGGGGVAGSNTSAQPTKATVKIATTGTSQTLGAVQATLHMPTGVSVKATVNPPQTDGGIVLASGAASGADLVMGIYSSLSGTVTVYITKATGFSTGEFSTINCDIASGTLPRSSDFVVTDLSTWDTSGSLVTALTPTFTVIFN